MRTIAGKLGCLLLATAVLSVSLHAEVALAKVVKTKTAGEIMAIRLGEHGENTRLVLDMSADAKFTSFALAEPNRLVIDVTGVTWGTGVKARALGLVDGATTSTHGAASRLEIALAKPARIKSSSVLKPQDGKKYRLVIDLTPMSEAAFRSAAKTSAPEEPQTAAEDQAPPAPVPTADAKAPLTTAVASLPSGAAPAAKAEKAPAAPPQARPAPDVTPAPAPIVKTAPLSPLPPAAKQAPPAKVSAAAPARPQQTAPAKQQTAPAKTQAAVPATLPTPQARAGSSIASVVPAAPPPTTRAAPDDVVASLAPKTSAAPPKPKVYTTPRSYGKHVIVVDPGHGGPDPGAGASDGTLEKDVVLAAAQELGAVLEATGRYTVVYTRSDDSFLKLAERVRIAREARASLFISLHADALSNDPTVGGMSIYTLSEKASDIQSARLAQKENGADIIGGVDVRDEPEDVTRILIDLAQRQTKDLSAQFARTVLSDLDKGARLAKNTHRSAGFKVLKAVDVPSCLIELGYLSNADDLVNLTSSEWRARVATSIAVSIDDYFRSLGDEPVRRAEAPVGQ